MTVQELIEELQAFPSHLLVVRSGYEGGVEGVSGASITKLLLNQNTAWYYGPHETTNKDGPDVVKAVYIG